MKRARLTKLALSGAAVAALAATFSTSTYAWYVSNKVANVNGGAGNTGSAGADGSVLLAWSSSPAKWLKEIDFSMSDAPSISSVQMAPCHYSDTAKDGTTSAGFYGISGDGTQGSKLTANQTADSFIEFTLYAKTESSSGVKVIPTLVINNNTTYASTLEQVNYGSSTTGAPNDSATFLKDALDALYIQQTFNGKTTSTDAAAADHTSYVAASKSGVKGSSDLAAHAAGTGNAHTYYKYVNTGTAKTYSVVDTEKETTPTAGTIYYTRTGSEGSYVYTKVGTLTAWASGTTYCTATANALWCEEPTIADAAVATTSLDTIVLSTTATAITYRIFLDGGDTDCFNSCQNQSFTFAFTYTVDEA